MSLPEIPNISEDVRTLPKMSEVATPLNNKMNQTAVSLAAPLIFTCDYLFVLFRFGGRISRKRRYSNTEEESAFA